MGEIIPFPLFILFNLESTFLPDQPWKFLKFYFISVQVAMLVSNTIFVDGLEIMILISVSKTYWNPLIKWKLCLQSFLIWAVEIDEIIPFPVPKTLTLLSDRVAGCILLIPQCFFDPRYGYGRSFHFLFISYISCFNALKLAPIGSQHIKKSARLFEKWKDGCRCPLKATSPWIIYWLYDTNKMNLS